MWTEEQWQRNLLEIHRLAISEHGPMQVGQAVIAPVTGQPYGISADAPATITRLRITHPAWAGWRSSWRDAYRVARHLDRHERWVAAIGGDRVFDDLRELWRDRSARRARRRYLERRGQAVAS